MGKPALLALSGARSEGGTVVCSRYSASDSSTGGLMDFKALNWAQALSNTVHSHLGMHDEGWCRLQFLFGSEL